jgi:hypothetical protein
MHACGPECAVLQAPCGVARGHLVTILTRVAVLSAFTRSMRLIAAVSQHSRSRFITACSAWAAVLAVTLLTLLPQAHSAATPVAEHQLANGLRILVKPDHRAPVVVFDGVVPGRQHGRAAGRHRPRARARAHDVQGHEEGARRRVLAHHRRCRRARQRFHEPRLHRLLSDAAQVAAAACDEARGRPHGESQALGRGVRQGDPRGDGGAPLAHRRPAPVAGLRAACGGSLPRPPLPQPRHRLDERSAQHDGAGRPSFLRTMVRAQQRAPGCGGRCAAGGGAQARRGAFRRAIGKDAPGAQDS